MEKVFRPGANLTVSQGEKKGKAEQKHLGSKAVREGLELSDS